MATQLKSKNGEWFPIGLIVMLVVGFILAVMLANVPLRKGIVPQTTSVAGKVSSLGISYQSDAVVTVGNHSYILIFPREDVRIKGFPQAVLELIDAFEQDHPELDVTGWKLLIDVSGGPFTDTEALGIFLDHQPRQW